MTNVIVEFLKSPQPFLRETSAFDDILFYPKSWISKPQNEMGNFLEGRTQHRFQKALRIREIYENYNWSPGGYSLVYVYYTFGKSLPLQIVIFYSQYLFPRRYDSHHRLFRGVPSQTNNNTIVFSFTICTYYARTYYYYYYYTILYAPRMHDGNRMRERRGTCFFLPQRSRGRAQYV